MTMQEGFLLLYIALQAADMWSTVTALKQGHREANPLLAKLFTRFPPVPVMVAIKIPGVWALWWADMTLLTAAACAVYLYVVINNLRVIGKV